MLKDKFCHFRLLLPTSDSCRSLEISYTWMLSINTL